MTSSNDKASLRLESKEALSLAAVIAGFYKSRKELRSRKISLSSFKKAY